MPKKRWSVVAVVIFATLSFAACGDDDAGEATGADADAVDGCQTGTDQEVTEGLTYVELECGDGEEAATGDTVTVHYTGKLQDGTEFDSSVGGEPFTFILGNGLVIQGWEQGVPGMRVGGTRELTIAPELGYGEAGYGPVPPDATLVFEIELLEVDPAAP
ncbi:MAG TPA: FKBP-type peptidyl-prolyl cis-trans isomerase [Actinomycetota bacterium]|nr:FKBP-type peptidyl-prolyl cis-trans isomerase [Actinomycetota bacterium]